MTATDVGGISALVGLTAYELWIRPWELGREQPSRSFVVVWPGDEFVPEAVQDGQHMRSQSMRQQVQCGRGFFRLDRIAPVTTVIRGWRTCSEPKFITSQGLFQSSRFAAQVTMCGWRRSTSTEAKPGWSLHVWTRECAGLRFARKIRNPQSKPDRGGHVVVHSRSGGCNKDAPDTSRTQWTEAELQRVLWNHVFWKPAHFIMEPKMMMTIKTLAEQLALVE